MKKNEKEEESEYQNNNVVGVLGGLLVGSVAGAVAMLLFAPQSGRKTRMQIQEKSIELVDQTTNLLEEAFDQVRSDGKKLTKDGRQKAKELLHSGQDMVIEQLEHVSDAAQAGKKAIQNA